MKTIAATLAILLGLSNCGPASKLRRAERLINQAEQAGYTWKIDTVTVKVPVIVTETRLDSILVVKPGDTVVLTKDRLKVKYVRLGADTVFLEAECAADTIYKEVPVRIEKMIAAKCNPWWWLLVAAIVGVVFGMFLMRRK